MPNSQPPRGTVPPVIPTHGSGTPYIIASVVLVAIIAGVLWFKFRGGTPPTPPPALPSVSVAQTVPPPAFDLPPPPPLETTDGGDEGGVKKPAAGGGSVGGGFCGSPCQGTETPALVSALRGAAGSARGCYERALRTNSMLQGRLTIAVRVGGNGSVCSATVAQDGLHSAEVSSCVLGLFRGRPFPAPGGGSCVDVTVPLSFTPQEGKK